MTLASLRGLPAVQTLAPGMGVLHRGPRSADAVAHAQDLPSVPLSITSPYDGDARYRKKRDIDEYIIGVGMRIMYLTNGFPYPLTSGYLRHYFLIRELSQRHAVTLLSITGASFT